MSRTAVPQPPVADVRRASVGYADTTVLRDVDFRLDPGEVVALLGPNGCGKSTLVKGMLGLAQVTDGEVHLFGRPVRDAHARSRIGYVPQRVAVAGGLPVTVREVVSSGRVPRSRLLRPTRAADRAAVAHAAAVVGLSDRLGSRMSELSGGQQRRVLIARALAGEPEALVMDEPMAGVDHENQAMLAATLAGLVADGMTVLLVLHEIGPLLPLISRVVAMAQGGIVYDGPPRDVDVHYHDLVDHEHDSGRPATSDAYDSGRADPFRLSQPFRKR